MGEGVAEPSWLGDTGVHVRVAVAADAPSIVDIRRAAWRMAYADMLPPAVLDDMPADDAEVQRRRAVMALPGVETLVAQRAQEVVGFAAYGPSRDEDVAAARTELFALYVHPGQWSTGAGRALMTAVLQRREPGTALSLWVLEGNARARRFYARAGLAADGARKPCDVGGATVWEVRYGTPAVR